MPPLTPQDFVGKWKRAEARERQSVEEYFINLYGLMGHETPLQADPTGKQYAFEMGAAKTSGGSDWADVAKLGYFGWEYKGKHANLDKAYDQLLRYRDVEKWTFCSVLTESNHYLKWAFVEAANGPAQYSKKPHSSIDISPIFMSA